MTLHLPPVETPDGLSPRDVQFAIDKLSQITARKIVRGAVSSNGTIAFGEGFTVNRTGAGVYVVTYTTAFTVAAAVTVTLGQTLAPVAQARVLDNASSTGCTVQTFDNSGAAADSVFFFHAIGRD